MLPQASEITYLLPRSLGCDLRKRETTSTKGTLFRAARRAVPKGGGQLNTIETGPFYAIPGCAGGIMNVEYWCVMSGYSVLGRLAAQEAAYAAGE